MLDSISNIIDQRDPWIYCSCTIHYSVDSCPAAFRVDFENSVDFQIIDIEPLELTEL